MPIITRNKDVEEYQKALREDRDADAEAFLKKAREYAQQILQAYYDKNYELIEKCQDLEEEVEEKVMSKNKLYKESIKLYREVNDLILRVRGLKKLIREGL